MKLFGRRHNNDEAQSAHTRPPPHDPIEVGLALRTARERAGLSLADARERIDVPIIDLDALERGALDVFHVEQAAVIAIWRYSELLELDPEPLAGVVRSHWPNRALALDALRPSPGLSGPIAQLAAGRRLLEPIAHPRELTSGKASFGLSRATLQILAASSAANLLTAKALVPSTARNKAAKARSQQLQL